MAILSVLKLEQNHVAYLTAKQERLRDIRMNLPMFRGQQELVLFLKARMFSLVLMLVYTSFCV
jgi:hypothetical protein